MNINLLWNLPFMVSRSGEVKKHPAPSHGALSLLPRVLGCRGFTEGRGHPRKHGHRHSLTREAAGTKAPGTKNESGWDGQTGARKERWGIQGANREPSMPCKTVVPSNIQATTGPGLESWALGRCSAQGGTFKGSGWTLETETSLTFLASWVYKWHCQSKSLPFPKTIRSASVCGSHPPSTSCQLLQTPRPGT